jgi:hypothetical protein
MFWIHLTPGLNFFFLYECTIFALHDRDFRPDKSVTILGTLSITQ